MQCCTVSLPESKSNLKNLILLFEYRHYAKIQDYDSSFYSQFHVVVCGLDSIVARRWINGMLLSLLEYEDGELNTSTYGAHQAITCILTA